MIYFESNFMVSQNNIILYTWYLSKSLSLKIICLLHPLIRHTVFLIRIQYSARTVSAQKISTHKISQKLVLVQSRQDRLVLVCGPLYPPMDQGTKIKQFMVFRLRQAHSGFAKMHFYQFRNNLWTRTWAISSCLRGYAVF